ncbi:MAG: hypothetical protein VX475_08475 [Myxococcota bacterium]|jgi:hypothetical protein|nr:hypothetical protein [Myxococcota bacterium]
MKRSMAPSILLALIAVTLGAGCERPATPQPPQTFPTPSPEAVSAARAPVIELEVYDVPANTGDRLRPILQIVLGEHGKVQQVPDGRLLVAAPRSVHEGLEAFFKEGIKLEPKARDTIKIEYWFVTASLPNGTEDRKDPRLTPVADALAAIEKSQGLANFKLEEHISLAATDGEYALTRGEIVNEINQTASVQGEQVEAHVEISLAKDARELSTKLRVEKGQTVVLGQAGWGDVPNRDMGDMLGKAPQGETLFYIIRVTSTSP